jgi:hypothetical protein
MPIARLRCAGRPWALLGALGGAQPPLSVATRLRRNVATLAASLVPRRPRSDSQQGGHGTHACSLSLRGVWRTRWPALRSYRAAGARRCSPRFAQRSAALCDVPRAQNSERERFRFSR